MRENKTGVRLPVSPKKRMAERQARESLAAVAQGWGAPQQSQAECEGVRNVTDEPGESPVLVCIPEDEKPAKGETLSAAARRRIWERSRYESMRLLPDAMAFHEEALARAKQQGEFEKLAKANGLSEEEVRRVWDVHQDHHRIRVAAQAAGRTAEVPEVEDADDDEQQTGEVSAREPTNEPEADVPRENVEEPRSKFTEAPDPHAISVTQPKPEPKPKPMEQSQQQPVTSETENVSCHQSERTPVGRLSEARRRINEEVGREEHLRALAAAQRLAREGDEAIWEESLRFIKDRLRRTGVWTGAAGVCLLAGILAADLMGLRSRAIESVTSFTVFAPQPAVVDRQAARKALLDLAGRAALEDVIVASEAFDDLFVLACARVAARENLLLLDSRAVVAMARGGEDATERIKEEIVDLVQKGAVARFKEIRRDRENR